MSEASVLRLFSCRPRDSGPVFDATLRDALPRFAALPGLIDAFVGRQGADDGSDRVVASMWASQDAMRAALTASGPDERFEIERSAEVGEASIEVLPVAVIVRVDRDAEARVLRVFRGVVAERDLSTYVEEARTGTLADVAAGRGPLALYLAIDPPARFVTVSAWTGWDVIALATGGNVRQPIATRNSKRLISWTAEHYEILPDAAGRPIRPPAPIG